MLRALFICPLLMVACFNPNVPDAELHCGMQGQCPSGMTCVANLCYRDSSASMLDLSMPDLTVPGPYGSGSLGMLDLTGKAGILFLDTESGAISLQVAGIDGGAPMSILEAQSTDGKFAVAQSSATSPNVAIWSFTELTIPRGIVIQPTLDSISIPVLAATGDLVFEGSASWVGFGRLGGLAGKSSSSGDPSATPAGGGGSDGSGGGGGGYAMTGTAGSGGTGGAGGLPFGDADLTQLLVGGGGGGGGGSQGGVGGNGGGAFGLLAHHLVLGGTVDASGISGSNGETAASSAAGGGGGGAGGSILLSGDMVSFESGASFVAKGASGGSGTAGGNDGGPGSVGRILLAAASLVGTPNADPTATISQMPLVTFPR